MTSKPAKKSPGMGRRYLVRHRIEVATLELCLQKGIDSVTVADAAEASGVSRRTFYRYFNSINDVLTAWPARSVERLSRALRDRPVSENLREAFINATKSLVIPEDETMIHSLAARAYIQFPDDWMRAMAPIQRTANKVYAEMIARRLTDRGSDPSQAPLLAAVLLAVIGATFEGIPDKATHRPDRIDEALRYLSTAFES